MQISRRIYNKKTGVNKNIVVSADLIRENKRTVLVRLMNGDIIKRKKSDIVRG